MLFVTPSGESVLIDSGNGGTAAVRDAERILGAAKDAGLTQIDHLITTHYHGDHIGGLAELAARLPIKEFIDHGPNTQPNPATDAFLQGGYRELYGKTNWLPSMTLDTKNAIMEDEAFREIAQLPIWQQASPDDVQGIEMLPDYPSAVASMTQWAQLMGAQAIPWPKVYPALDGHAIHSREHGNFGKSESFRQFPPLIQAMVEKHKAYHDQLLIQQMAAVQGGQIQGGFLQPAPGGAMPQQQPMNTSSSPARLAGDHAEMTADVASGGM